MSHATHANAALTPRARIRQARLIVDQKWPIPRAAERYDVSWKTAAKWADRYREEGPAGMSDRACRPHHQPYRTEQPVFRKIVHLRWKQRLGAVEIGDRLGLPASTSTRSWSTVASTSSATLTTPPASRSAATSASDPVT